MKLEFDFDQVRVIQTNNYKGNPRVYVEVMGARVLYSDPYALAADEHMRAYVSADGEVDTDSLAEMFRWRLAHFFRDIFLRDDLIAGAFSTDTDREIGYTKPRIETLDPDHI